MGRTVIVDRFGTPGLVERLIERRCSDRRRGWRQCGDGGRNFSLLCLGGYVLTVPSDDQCSENYEVTITDGVTGQRFRIRGYCFPDLIRAIESGPPAYKRSSIDGVPFFKRAGRGHMRPYMISVWVA